MPTRVGRTSFVYDAAGRVVRTVTKRISKKPLVRSFYYATGAQPIGFDSSDQPGVGYRYVYDGLKRRVAKETIDTATGNVTNRVVFAHAGNQLVAEHTSVGADRGRGFVWTTDPETGEIIGQITLTPQTSSNGGRHRGGDYQRGETQYGDASYCDAPRGDVSSWSQDEVDAEFFAIVADLAGAPHEIIHPDTGDVVGTASQTLYGQRTWRGEQSSPLLFAGQYADVESGWAYNRFRYYNPHAGIYNAQDPLGAPLRLASAQGYVDHAAFWVDVYGLKSCGEAIKDTSDGLQQEVDVPVFEVSRSRDPEVAVTLDKVAKDGQPTLLQRTTDQSQIAKNRREAKRGWDYSQGSPDEFPYAPSMQGGAGATVHGVSLTAQRSQGAKLKNFYDRHNIQNGDFYQVKLVD